MKKGLGRGIKTIFPDELTAGEPEGTVKLKISDVEPNRKQPRKDFDEEKLSVLASSIAEFGVIQPIIVKKNKYGRYIIVAGERRWRAAKKAGLTEIPALVKEYTDEETAKIALIENLQRENLNPVEEALGYQSLIDEFSMTQESVSESVGKSRSAVANSLRLLSLEDDIKKLVISGALTGGHARAVLSLKTAEQRRLLAEKIIECGLNVRQAESMAKRISSEKPAPAKKADTVYDIELRSVCERLSEKFGTKVTLKKGTRKNKLQIEYYSDEDLERIINILDEK